MSTDIVDDLHAAEDHIRRLEHVLGRLVDILPDHWRFIDVVVEAHQALAAG